MHAVPQVADNPAIRRTSYSNQPLSQLSKAVARMRTVWLVPAVFVAACFLGACIWSGLTSRGKASNALHAQGGGRDAALELARMAAPDVRRYNLRHTRSLYFIWCRISAFCTVYCCFHAPSMTFAGAHSPSATRPYADKQL